MKIVEGDLLLLAQQGHFDVIIHGCNCFHTMGGGIAYAVKSLFPEAYEADLETVRGAQDKLGTLSVAEVVRGEVKFLVVNAYTQFGFGGNRVNVDYAAVRQAMAEVKRRFSGMRTGYPKIGSGLAGGDWDTISKIIDEELLDEDHTLVIL